MERFDRGVRDWGEDGGESVYTILDKTGRSSSYRYPRFMDHRGIQWRVRRATFQRGIFHGLVSFGREIDWPIRLQRISRAGITRRNSRMQRRIVLGCLFRQRLFMYKIFISGLIVNGSIVLLQFLVDPFIIRTCNIWNVEQDTKDLL